MSFLRDYLIYSTRNEAPQMFHVWSGYATISAAIGRRVWLPLGETVMYPNIYVLLIGAAGSGKSTALRNAKRLISRLDNVQMAYSVETPEGLCKFMGGDPKKDPPIISPCCQAMTWPDGMIRDTHSIAICANEFIDFISKNQEGWTSMLNNIYDEDLYNYRTKNQGEDSLLGPYVVLLGAIPTEVSKKLQRQEIIDTGFARRSILQYGERQTDNPVPDHIFGDEEKAARDRCLERLREIQRFRGAMFRTPESAKWWHAWYTKHSKSIAKRATPSTQGWLMSKPDQVIKLAILNSLSERNDLQIHPEHYQLGLEFLDTMEKSFNMVFGGIGRNELAAVSMKILEHLTAINEPMTYKAMCSKFFIHFSSGKRDSELSEVLEFLIATEQLDKRTIKVSATAGLTSEEAIYATPAAMTKFLSEAGALPNVVIRDAEGRETAASSGPSAVQALTLGLTSRPVVAPQAPVPNAAESQTSTARPDATGPA